jgi:phage gp29-like protein
VVILDQFGRPFEQQKRPERHPLAAAPISDAWREYVSSGLTPQRLAGIFREADTGDVARQAALFEQVEEKDGHLTGERTKRQNAILDVDFQVFPASEDSRDVRVAEFVREYFQNCADWEDVLVSLQDGVGKGYAGLETKWDVSGGQALPSGFEFVEQKRFLFQDRSGLLSRTPRLITDSDSMGVEIPAWKMLFHRYGGKSGHPTRSGIYRVCAWMYLFKNYSIKDWVVFAEVYGMPLRLGKYGAGASESDKDALVQAISSLGSDAAGIISRSTEIEFVETVKGTASGDLYKTLASFCNAEMSKALLGQTLTAEVGETGSYAASQTHNEIREDLLKADARAVAATIRDQLIRPVVGFNFGWDTDCPGYRPVFDEPEDMKTKSEWVTALLDRGVAMPASFIRREFRIPEQEKDEEMVGQTREPVAAKQIERPGYTTLPRPLPDQGGGKAVAAKSEPEKDTADIYGDQARKNAGPLVDGMVDEVRKLVSGASSLEEIRDRLPELVGMMASDALAEELGNAFMASELAGRYEILEGLD